jgi:hypothetical protein
MLVHKEDGWYWEGSRKLKNGEEEWSNYLGSIRDLLLIFCLIPYVLGMLLLCFVDWLKYDRK